MSAIWWFLYGQFVVLIFFVTWVAGMLAKTHAKAAQTKTRVDALIGVAKTVNTVSATVTAVAPIATAGNASFLAGLSPAGGMTSGSSGFGGGVWTADQQSALLTLQGVANGIISSLGSNGFT